MKRSAAWIRKRKSNMAKALYLFRKELMTGEELPWTGTSDTVLEHLRHYRLKYRTKILQR